MTIITQRKKKLLIEAPEIVTGTWTSPYVSIDDRVGAFSVLFRYANGIGADMKVYVQLSDTMEDADFATVVETEAIINDASGNILYDLNGSGAQYLRILVEVTAGTIEVETIRFTGSQFH